MNTKSNIVIIFMIIAVGFVSFIGGRISADQKNVVSETAGAEKGSVMDLPVNPIQNPSSAKPAVVSADTASSSDVGGENLFVASKNGQKYFPISCGSAKLIKPENAIYYKTMEEAEASGRTQSVQCKY